MSDGAAAQDKTDLLTITVEIVSAHLRHNKVPAEVLPGLISSVHQALAGLGSTPAPEPQQASQAAPARRSIFPEYLVCLEDGAKVKMLKPYLQRRFGLTPAAYRAKWGLPSDYPMVAPAYAARRSALARQFGLGSNPRGPAPADASADAIDADDLPADTRTDEAPPAAETVEQQAAAPSEPDSPPAEPMIDDAEIEYTAEAVFANFGPPGTGATDGPPAPKPKRKRFSDQMTRQMPSRRNKPS